MFGVPEHGVSVYSVRRAQCRAYGINTRHSRSLAVLAITAIPRLVGCADLPLFAQAAPVPVLRRQLPVLPTQWAEVPGTRIVTDAQWFAEFRHPSGKTLQLHSVSGLGFSPLPSIARIRLSEYSVRVSKLNDGYEARWETATAAHRVWCSGSLAPVMELLYSFSWTETPTTASPSRNFPQTQLSGT